MTQWEDADRTGLPDPFERAVALWAIGLAGSDRVAVAAAALVAAGSASPALADLAGRVRGENWFEMKDVITQAFAEMGRPVFDPTSSRVRHAAVADYAIDFLNGRRPASEVPALAYRLQFGDEVAPSAGTDENALDEALSTLAHLDDDARVMSEAARERKIRRAARHFLTRFGSSRSPLQPTIETHPEVEGDTARAIGTRNRGVDAPNPQSSSDMKQSLDNSNGRISLWLLLVALVASIPFSAALCISDVITSGDPVYTGVLTVTYVDTVGRGPDTKYGTFRSDDGSIVRDDMKLVGPSEPSGTAVVTYKPSGIMSDAMTNTVYTPSRREFAATMPWVVFFGSSIIVAIIARVWRAMRAEKADARLSEAGEL